MNPEIKLPKLPNGCYYYVKDGNTALQYKMTVKNPNGGDDIILKQGQVSLNEFKVDIHN
jgi:hypothetical protein